MLFRLCLNNIAQNVCSSNEELFFQETISAEGHNEKHLFAYYWGITLYIWERWINANVPKWLPIGKLKHNYPILIVFQIFVMWLLNQGCMLRENIKSIALEEIACHSVHINKYYTYLISFLVSFWCHQVRDS